MDTTIVVRMGKIPERVLHDSEVEARKAMESIRKEVFLDEEEEYQTFRTEKEASTAGENTPVDEQYVIDRIVANSNKNWFGDS